MGRKKISIKPIAHPSTRRATFEKRRIGLLKKAMELSILCKSTVSLTIYTSEGDVYIYASEPYENVVQKFQNYRGPYRLLTNDHLSQLIPGKSASNSIGFEIIKQPHSASAPAVDQNGPPLGPNPMNPHFVMPSIQNQTTESNTTDSVTPIAHSMVTNSNSSSSKEISPPPPVMSMGHGEDGHGHDSYSPHQPQRTSYSELYRYNPMTHGQGRPQQQMYRQPQSAYYGHGAYPPSPRRQQPSARSLAYAERSNIHDFVAPMNNMMENKDGDRNGGSGEIQIKQDPCGNMGNVQDGGHGQHSHQEVGKGGQMSTESTSEPKSKTNSFDKQFDDLVPEFDMQGMFDDEGGPHDLAGNMSSPFL